MNNSHKKLPVLGTQLSLGSYDDMVAAISTASRTRESGSAYTCCVNVHMIIEAYQDRSFQRVVNNADFGTVDGNPLTTALSLFHNVDQPRVAGMDLLPSILKYGEEQGLRIFFLGDTDEVLGKLETQIKKEFPRLSLAGFYSPPFRPLSEEEDQDLIDRINQAQTDVLFVALGCPKQEKWMADHHGKVKASMVGVGNAFRAYLGLEKRAPEWMRSLSLEWLFRFAQNPKRLWKRYMVTNSVFLWLVAKTWLGQKLSPSKKVVSAS